ncbi:MAG: hypothetical protein OXU20_02880 [Myxococcales bacterium]|nr:hypothetical protein [Myxococcales bacterium]MDD9965160.1 hypothetical protein [Myxococcales bacterium]
MKQAYVSALGLCIAALLACGQEDQLNIGEIGKSGANLRDYAGSWTGHAEAYAFTDDSDYVRISLDEDGGGVIEVGNTEPWPDPDPTKGYPPKEIGPVDPLMERALLPGFAYPIADSSFDGERLRLQVNTLDPFAEWCAGMEPVFHDTYEGVERYECLANEGTSLKEGPSGEDVCTLGEETIDCGLWLCASVCQCDAEACSVFDDPEGAAQVHFDGALEDGGTTLVGTLVLSDRLTIRLKRD